MQELSQIPELHNAKLFRKNKVFHKNLNIDSLHAGQCYL